MLKPNSQRVARRYEMGDWATGFFQRHPKLRSYKNITVVNKETGGTESASQQQGKIVLYPKFWKHPPKLQDQIFAHEIGHLVLDNYGLNRFTKLAEKHGIDPWDTLNLPFGQHNMHEAFADSFASYAIDGEVKRRYPEWAALVKEVS